MLGMITEARIRGIDRDVWTAMQLEAMHRRVSVARLTAEMWACWQGARVAEPTDIEASAQTILARPGTDAALDRLADA